MCYQPVYMMSAPTPPFAQACAHNVALQRPPPPQPQPSPSLSSSSSLPSHAPHMPTMSVAGFVVNRPPGGAGVYAPPPSATAAAGTGHATTTSSMPTMTTTTATTTTTAASASPWYVPVTATHAAPQLPASHAPPSGPLAGQPQQHGNSGDSNGGVPPSCTPVRAVFANASATLPSDSTAYGGSRLTIGAARVPLSLSQPAASSLATATATPATVWCAPTLGAMSGSSRAAAATTPTPTSAGASATAGAAPASCLATHATGSDASGATGHTSLLTPTPHYGGVHGSAAAAAALPVGLPYATAAKLDDSPTSMCSAMLFTNPSSPFAPHMSLSGQSSSNSSTAQATGATLTTSAATNTTAVAAPSYSATHTATTPAATAAMVKSPFGPPSITLYPVDPNTLLPLANGTSFFAIPAGMANASFLALSTTAPPPPQQVASAAAAASTPPTSVADVRGDAAGHLTLAALERNLTTHYTAHAPVTPAPASAAIVSPAAYDVATTATTTIVPRAGSGAAPAVHFAHMVARQQPPQEQASMLYAQQRPQASQLPLLGVRSFMALPPVGRRHVPHTTLITTVPPLALPLVRPGRMPAMTAC